MDQTVILLFEPVQSRVAQSLAFSRRHSAAVSRHGRAHRVPAEIPRQEIEPVLARPIFRIDTFFRDLERQASIFDNVRRQYTQLMSVTNEKTREFAYADRSDNVGRRKPEGDNQDFHCRLGAM